MLLLYYFIYRNFSVYTQAEQSEASPVLTNQNEKKSERLPTTRCTGSSRGGLLLVVTAATGVFALISLYCFIILLYFFGNFVKCC